MAQKQKQKQKQKQIEYTHHTSNVWYRVIRGFFWVVFHTIWPLRATGMQNVPQKGAAVIVCNHLSLIDPFVVGYAANRLVNFMGKEELFGIPVLGFLIRQVGSFPVDRSRRDPAAMRIAFTILKEGELLGMFPEGTRSTTGEMIEFRTGAVRLAAKTHAPIVPVALINTNNAMPPGKFLRPARIGVRFGKPIELTELYQNPKDEGALERALEIIKEKIGELHVGDVRR